MSARNHLALLPLALAAAVPAQISATSRAVAKFESFRPTDDQLVVYRLDWVGDFAEARRRAAAERRPILLVRIHAKYGDLFSGHC